MSQNHPTSAWSCEQSRNQNCEVDFHGAQCLTCIVCRSLCHNGTFKWNYKETSTGDKWNIKWQRNNKRKTAVLLPHTAGSHVANHRRFRQFARLWTSLGQRMDGLINAFHHRALHDGTTSLSWTSGFAMDLQWFATCWMNMSCDQLPHNVFWPFLSNSTCRTAIAKSLKFSVL